MCSRPLNITPASLASSAIGCGKIRPFTGRSTVPTCKFSLVSARPGPKCALGMQFFLFVDNVEEFHALHRGNGAEITSPIENKPWGVREYTVRDPWGYELRFAGPEKHQRPSDARDSLPPNIRIVERMPTVDEYVAVVKSVNWSHNAAFLAAALQNSAYGAVAVDVSHPGNPKTVGMLANDRRRRLGLLHSGRGCHAVASKPTHRHGIG